MTEKISKSHFKPRALEFFREIEASGRPLIITDNGIPTLEIRPYRNPSDPTQTGRLESLLGSIIYFEPPK